MRNVRTKIVHKRMFDAVLVICSFADQAFLRHRRDKPSIPREYAAAGHAAGSGGTGAVLCVEQPVVESARSVEPHRVVEARHLKLRIEDRCAMGIERGVEQGHVREIGKDCRLIMPVVGNEA